jgi:hypothetical protein
MQLYVDAGLSPMEALLSSTKWASEILRLEKQLGTVEPNKLADLVILRANPLENIGNLKAVDRVIRGGEIADISYHSDYKFPFSRPGPESKHLYNLPPRLRDVIPPVATQESETRLRIVGEGFVANSVVFFNGSPLETKWVSSNELSAVLSAGQASQAGSFLITVQSPKPGGGVSESLEFIVTYPDK